MRIKKSLLKNVGVLFVGLVFALLLGECLVRLFLPQRLYNKFNSDHPSFPFTMLESDVGWVFKPDLDYFVYGEDNSIIHVKTNSQGFRDVKNYTSNKSGKIRVGFFGDSFMFGDGVDQDETLPFFVENLSNNSIESYNFGVEGFSFGQSYLMFLSQYLLYKPDVVIFSIFHNDLIDENIFVVDTVAPPRFEKFGANLTEISKYINNVQRISELEELFLFNFPATFDKNKIEIRHKEHLTHEYKGTDKFLRSYSHLYNSFMIFFRDNYSLQSVWHQDKFLFWFIKKHRFMEESKELVCNMIKSSNKVASQNNISAIFIYIPDAKEVSEEIRYNVFKKQGYDTRYNIKDLDFSLLGKFFEDCFRSNNITYLNLYYEFLNQTEVSAEELYNARSDCHLSAIGTEFIARKLLDLMKKKNLYK